MNKELLCKYIVFFINNLEEKDRRIFLMKHFENVDSIEISKKLNIPEERVLHSLENSSQQLIEKLKQFKAQIIK